MKPMRNLRRHAPVAFALILASLSSSCWLVSRPRNVFRGHGRPATAAQTLLTATREELTDKIARQYNAINSFQATVDMTPSKGSVYTGQLTEYKDFRAFVLFRKPADIHIIGQLPVVRTKAFDMLSNGISFSLFLVQNNLFVEGLNNAPATSKNPMENLRPEAFLSSMLVRPADSATEVPVLIDQTDEEDSHYNLLFMSKNPDGTEFVSREVWFDRVDALNVVRQIVHDTNGDIVSDTRYNKWTPYGGVAFPGHIDINRWKDGYGAVLDLVDMQMNRALTDDQFTLPQPEGAKLQLIGDPKQENH